MSDATTRINAECAAGVWPCEPGCKRFGAAAAGVFVEPAPQAESAPCSFCGGVKVVHGEQCVACAGKGYSGDPRPSAPPRELGPHDCVFDDKGLCHYGQPNPDAAVQGERATNGCRATSWCGTNCLGSNGPGLNAVIDIDYVRGWHCELFCSVACRDRTWPGKFSAPDPDAAVRPLLKEGAKKWREAWENDTNETIDEFFLRMTTEVFFEGTSSTRAEAFAAGRALGRDEGAREEREAIRKLVADFDEDVDFDGQELLDDINIEIARRGSVPK